MGGGLMQLVAYGAQDVYLTGDPQITFFKCVYRRHTNFAVESIEQTILGTPGFGRRITCILSRNGDLVGNVLLEVTLPALTSGAWIGKLGNNLIESVEVYIGGQQIDQQWGTWMQMWDELTVGDEGSTEGWGSGYNRMLGNVKNLNGNDATTDAGTKLFIPLKFWFNDNSNALPLLALQYHEVKINVNFASAARVLQDGGAVTGDIDCSMYCDYIYLDNEERRRFAQEQHEYLIRQTQFTGEVAIAANEKTVKSRLDFNHPVKELLFAVHDSDNDAGNHADADGRNPVKSAKLMLNGHDRQSARDGVYYDCVVPSQVHSHTPSRGVNVISFALTPEKVQPSGSCNFSRIDNAQLVLSLDEVNSPRELLVYAVSVNVLRVMSGLGGLAYSN